MFSVCYPPAAEESRPGEKGKEWPKVWPSINIASQGIFISEMFPSTRLKGRVGLGPSDPMHNKAMPTALTTSKSSMPAKSERSPPSGKNVNFRLEGTPPPHPYISTLAGEQDVEEEGGGGTFYLMGGVNQLESLCDQSLMRDSCWDGTGHPRLSVVIGARGVCAWFVAGMAKGQLFLTGAVHMWHWDKVFLPFCMFVRQRVARLKRHFKARDGDLAVLLGGFLRFMCWPARMFYSLFLNWPCLYWPGSWVHPFPQSQGENHCAVMNSGSAQSFLTICGYKQEVFVIVLCWESADKCALQCSYAPQSQWFIH